MSYREAIQHERNSTDHISLVHPHSQPQQKPSQNSGWAQTNSGWGQALDSWQAEGKAKSGWVQPPQNSGWGQQEPLQNSGWGQENSGWGQSSDPWEAHGPSVDAWFAEPVVDRFMTKQTLLRKENQYFADHVTDMVPFWIRGIEAAERGEVLSLEEFLNSLESETWPPHGHDIWGHLDRQSNYGGRANNPWEPAWDNDAKKWGAQSVSSASVESGGRTGRSDVMRTLSHPLPSKSPSMRDPDSLVEVVARQKAVDNDRKQEMYTFLELPTNEKVKKIDDLIRTLRSS